jgi:hypothetical protein
MSSTYRERLLWRWADRRSPVERQATPLAKAPDEASNEEKAAHG